MEILLKRFSFLLLLLITCHSHADWWGGLDMGAYSWNPSPEGVIGNSDIDVNNDIHLNNQTMGVFWFAVEHLDTWYPNFRFEATTIDMVGNGTFADEKILRRAAFTGDVNSALSYHSYDLNAYYQAYDNFITLDLGVALRFFEGFIKIAREDGLLSEKANFSSAVPAAYAAMNIDIPLKGWYLGLIGNAGGYDRTLLTDVTAKLGWKYEFETLNYSHIGLELGYRQQAIKIHQIDDFNSDFDLSGGFAGVNFRWGF